MKKFEKAFIYFDTNILECWFLKDCLRLSKMELNNIFYKTEQIIKDFKLEDKVKICIPEIVLMEIKKHLLNCYKSKKESLKEVIDNNKKIFGDLLEISLEWKNADDLNKYNEYIDNHIKNFIDERQPILEIVPCLKDENTVEKIINKAMHTHKPFAIAHGNNKKYTDAGFKDALIYEIVCQHTGEEMGILASKDGDFASLFGNESDPVNLRICDTFESIKDLLFFNFDLNYTDVENLLMSNEYLIKTLLIEASYDETANYVFNEILSTEELEDGTKIKFRSMINGEKYIFEIIYELNANELVEVSTIEQEVDDE